MILVKIIFNTLLIIILVHIILHLVSNRKMIGIDIEGFENNKNTKTEENTKKNTEKNTEKKTEKNTEKKTEKKTKSSKKRVRFEEHQEDKDHEEGKDKTHQDDIDHEEGKDKGIRKSIIDKKNKNGKSIDMDYDEIDKQIKENFECQLPTNKQLQSQMPIKKITPANYYSTDANTPNFTSNVMDLRQFYSYDGINRLPMSDYQPPTDQIIKKVMRYPSYNQGNNGKMFKNDIWEYKNELPMNGGMMDDGVFGYDDNISGYAIYDNNGDGTIGIKVEERVNMKDDLRNGMGVPQKEEYKYNQSKP